MIEATKESFTGLVVDGVVVVDFYADWCGPCRALAPVLEQIQGARVVKVNVDKEQELALKYNVSSIPKLVVLKDGEVMSEMTGIQPIQTIQGKIDEARVGKLTAYDEQGKKIEEQG